MDHRLSIEEEGSTHLQIGEVQRLSETEESSGNITTMFEPRGMDKLDSSTTDNYVSPTPTSAPEKKLTLFALRLAVLEKAATGLGTLSFIWATVVLLGGFSISLTRTDFWFITIILVVEGTRIFSRSHELEWQHQATCSITDLGFGEVTAFQDLSSTSNSNTTLLATLKTFFISPILVSGQLSNSKHSNIETKEESSTPSRMWISSDVPLLPYAKWFFLSRHVSLLLYWLQLISATTCVVLSSMKLIVWHDYRVVDKGDPENSNHQSSLFIFYALALAEALFFLMEKAYWEWQVSYCRLLEEVNNECELGVSGMVSIRRFFYDAYSKCVNGSIFDGLKMDMVYFSMDLLASNSPDEQLIGARILRQFSISERFSEDTLQKIGISISVVERLVEMLNWTDHKEEEIRLSAAEILSKLAGMKQNSLRIAGIPGAMESISSLLHTSRSLIPAADEIGENNKLVFDHPNYAFWTFNHLGLLILKKLAHDHENCGKIGNTRGLLPKIIDLTHAEQTLLKSENVTPSQLLTVKRSLQLVKMLASTTGTTGEHLRREITEIVFTISNIRDILRHGEKHPLLQKLGIEILTSLALEDDATERIGGTGGVLQELFNIFFNNSMPENQKHVTVAGEALAMLALESKCNCQRILKLKVLERLVAALKDPLLRVNAARILRNLCIYSEAEWFNQLRGVRDAAPIILEAIMSEENKIQEVMVGLAGNVFKYMTSYESRILFAEARINEAELANKLIQLLEKHKFPSTKVPRIRRFTIELAIWMMKEKAENIYTFKDQGMEEVLEGVLETTSELENFNVFSGTVGLNRHKLRIQSLVETALKLMEDK